MSQKEFNEAYWNVGEGNAVVIAKFFGVTRAQIDLWLLSPTLKPGYWR